MARLNEPPVSAESVDSLKRRFLRQNRELAKSNSNQSIRIRALEAEVARLLSETITLRDTNHQLECEVLRHRNKYVRNVQQIHGDFEEKVGELNVLVQSLGLVYERAPRRAPSPAAVRTIRPDPTRPWKGTPTFEEIQAREEGQLPPLVEDDETSSFNVIANKHLENANSSVTTASSPDLGPPPIAHLEPDDLVSGDGAAVVSQSTSDSSKATLDVADLPAFSKSRRKKRESIDVSQMSRATLFGEVPILAPSSEKLSEQISISPRIGSKRKLSVREDIQPTMSSQAAQSPNSERVPKSNSRGSSRDTKTIDRSQHPKPSIQPSKESPRSRIRNRLRQNADEIPALQRRTALAPKTTNLEPVSPAKEVNQSKSDKNRSLSTDFKKPEQPPQRALSRRSSRDIREPVELNMNSISRPPRTVDIEIANTEANIAPEPETPVAPADIFSPPSTRPSTERHDSRDTPPPPDLDPSTSTSNLGIAGRTARRARGAISYAEPNLRDKMRRPTKELVDAVAGEGKFQRLSNVAPRGEEGSTTGIANDNETEQQAVRTVLLKKESGLEDAWRRIPAVPATSREQAYRAREKSPLGDKVATSVAFSEMEPRHLIKSTPALANTMKQELDIYDIEPTLSPEKKDGAASAKSGRNGVDAYRDGRSHRRRTSNATTVKTSSSSSSSIAQPQDKRNRSSPDTDGEEGDSNSEMAGKGPHRRRQSHAGTHGRSGRKMIETATLSSALGDGDKEGKGSDEVAKKISSRRRSMMV